MNPTRFLAALAVVGLWAASASADLRPEDAVRHIGETATVCDVVASAIFEANVRTSRRYWILASRLRTLFSPRLSTETIGQSSAPPRPPSGASASA
jgi:hypothetical protein